MCYHDTKRAWTGQSGGAGTGRGDGHGRAPPFGELLKRYRRAAGLTQEALAEQAGLSVRGISDLERGVNRAPRKDTRQSGPTIVAGHSYGGQIITALGTDAPNVVGLVYIAGFGLDEGEAIGALLSGPPTPALAHVSIRVAVTLVTAGFDRVRLQRR